MIKILHTGDIHLGDLAGPVKDGRNLRRLDTLACMEAMPRPQSISTFLIAGFASGSWRRGSMQQKPRRAGWPKADAPPRTTLPVNS